MMYIWYHHFFRKYILQSAFFKIRSINHVESLTSWKKIKAHSTQQKRDSIIASYPQQNPYLIL